MPSDPQLRRWYNKFNRLYWKGKLPDDTLVYWEPVPGGYADCNCFDDGEWVIRIIPGLAGWVTLAKLTLLHEMAHIAVHPYSGHDGAFDREIRRLMTFKGVRKLV